MVDADTYDSYLVPALFEPWSRDLIARAKVWKGDKVLDVACGTGIVACRIAGTGAQVTAIDSAADRIERAKRRSADESVSVKWLEGDAQYLPFRDPTFDLVTCQHGLQFVEDRARACREMRRVINPGGRVVIATWCALDQQGPYAALAALSPRDPAPYSLAEAATLTKLLTDAKFFAVNVETVRRQIRMPDPERFARLYAGEASLPDAMAALAPFIDGSDLVFSTTALLAVGRVKT